MSTPVNAVMTSLKTCRASRAYCACRDERVAPCCPTSATQHVTTFPCAKIQWVSCRDMTQQVEFGLHGASPTWSFCRKVVPAVLPPRQCPPAAGPAFPVEKSREDRKWSRRRRTLTTEAAPRTTPENHEKRKW